MIGFNPESTGISSARSREAGEAWRPSGRIGLAIALNTWRELMRDRLVISLPIVLALALALALACDGRPTDHGVAMVDLGFSLATGIGTLVAIFLGTAMVHKELDKRTVYVVLTKPATRGQFLVGKYLGTMATITALVLLLGSGLVTLALVLGCYSPAVLGLVAALWMELALVTAIAFCFACVTSGVLSALYTIGLLLVGQQTLMLKEFGDSEIKLHHANYLLGNAMYYLLPNFGAFDFKNTVLYGHHLPLAAWGYAMLYGAALGTAMLLMASVAWEGRELP